MHPEKFLRIGPVIKFFLILLKPLAHISGRGISVTWFNYFASAAVAVDSSHMTASSSTSWNRFSPPSNFVNGHVSTMWFMVCRWTQPQEGDWARPRLCKLARHGSWFTWFNVNAWLLSGHVWLSGHYKWHCSLRPISTPPDYSFVLCVVICFSTCVIIIGAWAGGLGGGLQPPESGKIFFSGNRAIFRVAAKNEK